MDSALILGLQISVLGLAITFLAMGLVIMVMILLMQLFPGKGAVKQAQVETIAPENADPATADADEQAREELAVALAVGICLLERDGALENRDPSLGKLLEQ